MTDKIEELKKEIERLELIVKEKFQENKVTQTIYEFNERQNYRIEIAEKKAELKGYEEAKKEFQEKIEIWKSNLPECDGEWTFSLDDFEELQKIFEEEMRK
jgi:hypothetical protein